MRASSGKVISLSVKDSPRRVAMRAINLSQRKLAQLNLTENVGNPICLTIL